MVHVDDKEQTPAPVADAMSDVAGDHPPVSATLEQRVLREHLASVYAGHSTAILAHLGFTTAIALFTYWNQRTAVPLYGLALLVAVDLYVLRLPRWNPSMPVADSAAWARRYAAAVTMVSGASAPISFFFVSTADPAVTTVITVVVIGSWTRAVQARWPLKPAMFGYGVPMISGLIAGLVWQGGALCLFLAAFCTVNLVLTLRFGVQQNKRLTESLILRFENEALATSLKEQIAISERASAEKTRFLAAASHDLRQPMHAVALFGAALENALVDHPAGENAERLMRAVNALSASLDTMLDVSRLDAGVVSADPRELDLDVLFQALDHTFAGPAEEKGLQLRLRASGLWVRSDVQLLYRMLSNLIDNALKYTQRGGVSVTARSRGSVVWIDVTDTGIGIAPEQTSRVFEEFYQVDNPGRDRARGLGIGLSIVKRLSRLLDHPVRVHSRQGRGTRFSVQLPLAEAVDHAATDLLLQGLESQVRHRLVAPDLGGRVLLIDDEAEIRVAMTELLRAYGIEVVAVADETQAIEVLTSAEAKARPFVILLCDYRLADGADGLEAGLRLCGRFLPSSSLLLITGETSPERLLSARASGVPMLFKPVSATALLRTMDAVVSAGKAGPMGPREQRVRPA